MTDGKTATPVKRRKGGAKSSLRLVTDVDMSVPVDPYRTILFPNNLRDMRRQAGYESLLLLAEHIPEIPYIRLSKIERGKFSPKPTNCALSASA